MAHRTPSVLLDHHFGGLDNNANRITFFESSPPVHP